VTGPAISDHLKPRENGARVRRQQVVYTGGRSLPAAACPYSRSRGDALGTDRMCRQRGERLQVPKERPRRRVAVSCRRPQGSTAVNRSRLTTWCSALAPTPDLECLTTARWHSSWIVSPRCQN